MEIIAFPPLIELTAYGGNFATYDAAVYDIFKRDLVDRKLEFQGREISLKKNPITNGREATYYHLTHDGEVESDRIPNLERMSKIEFIRLIIDNCDRDCCKVWRNKRGRDERILIFHEEVGYLVVLADRIEYLLFWTAYPVTREHTKRKLLKEYNDFIKGSL